MKNKIGISFVILLCLAGCTKKAGEGPIVSSNAPSVDKLAELQQNVEKAPSYENNIALGIELGNRSRFDEAVEVYERAVKINPKGAIAYNNICSTFNLQGRHADAVESCEKAVALEPNFELAKNNLREAKEKFTAFRNGVLAKKQELIKSAKTPADNLNSGMKFFLARDLESANQLWKKIPAGDEFYPAALNNLASSQILAGQFDEAEKTLSKALSLQPENRLFLNNKRWLESKKSTK